jgi:NADPH:quinone reductase-like Zn-dependent oxidoreductase
MAMRLFELRRFDLDGLVFTERREPEIGAQEVLVRLRAASLNYRDLLIVQGLYNPHLPLPIIPLSDGVGEIVAVGAEVAGLKPGDRVAGTFFEHWLSGELTDAGAKSALGGERDGVLSEYIVLHQDGVVPVPEHLTDEEAACLPCAGLTAWNALSVQCDVGPGNWVLIQGTGGVALFALQFAKALGAQVILSSRSAEKLARAQALGADVLIDTTETPDWAEQVRKHTQGRGVDAVIELGGAGSLNQSLHAVRRSGIVCLIGVLAGPGDVNIFPIIMNALRVQGVFVGSRQMFESMNQAIAQHRLKPVIDRVFPFTEARAALEYLGQGTHFGKICLHF